MEYNNVKDLAILLNSSVLTPFNLVQYLKIDSYRNLNISKKDNTLIARIDFEKYNSLQSMFYVFDYDDKLIEIYNFDNEGNKSIVFNKKDEVNKLLDKATSCSNDCVAY